MCIRDSLYVQGDLNVIGDIVYDEVTGRNINISGVSTLGGVKIGDPSGIITASSATGIVTYYGDASYLTGVSTSFSAAIGIQSGGTTIGAAITTVNFVGGSSTVTVQGTTGTIHLPTAGISIGLAIALGG